MYNNSSFPSRDLPFKNKRNNNVPSSVPWGTLDVGGSRFDVDAYFYSLGHFFAVILVSVLQAYLTLLIEAL